MKLVFQNGDTYSGYSFGSDKNVAGEVVFNTGMTGYTEALTDPSYRGQILVTTYPLQGNYGVPDGPFESERIQVQGLIVSHYSENPSHFKHFHSLGEWLKSQGVPAMSGVDTRSLTRYLREFGTLPGTLIVNEADDTIATVNISQVLDLVGQMPVTRYGESDVKILLIDTGGKENIIRCLVTRGVSVIRVPWHNRWEEYLHEVDGVFLANGPGDPEDTKGLIERVGVMLNEVSLPIFGICFGNQLLALASGARTTRMKYGHRSVNQPVQDLRTGKCYVTSQNHGYVVLNDSLSLNWEPWFINLNDGTNEGIRHKVKPICSVQFHPEASPGPNDTAFLFDDFIKTVLLEKTRKRPSVLVDKIERKVSNYAERC